tara:strand:- start:1224 stop:3674 length:2451 start_codon:yes stop_codon:yes gene_type:complete
MSFKKEKDIFAKLNRILNKDENLTKIKEWLETLKTYNSYDEKIPGLLNNSKLNSETANEDGGYNLILKWISLHLDNFNGFDFKDIPPSIVNGNINIDLSTIISTQDDAGTNIRIRKKEFRTEEDVKRWIDEPETHPITGLKMSPISSDYENIYGKAYKILKKTNVSTWFYENFPKNHILFGKLDLLFYTYISTDSGISNEESILCELLQSGLENTKDKDNILDTEIELFKNRFSNRPIDNPQIFDNYTSINDMFDLLKESMIENLTLRKGIISTDFKNLKIEDIMNCNGYAKKAEIMIKFMENYTFSNGKIIIDYLRELVADHATGDDNVVYILCKKAINIYDKFKKIYNDIKDLLDKNSGIIDNYEDKKFNIIEDPLDIYFKKYEDGLQKIKDPKFSKLIDLTTLKPVDSKLFLNDDQLKHFKAKKSEMEKDYLKSKNKYDESILKYKSINIIHPTNAPKSPTPPKRPIITLESGKKYQYGNIDPTHVSSSLIKEFNKEYLNSKDLLDEYNKIKNMSYLQLIKHETKNSPSKTIKDLSKGNILLSMNRQQINEEILYDYSDLKDKCSESKDILANEEFDDDNYPLSKLQLMVRLQIYNRDKTQYRTECIYAPKLYNYLVNSINNKEPFINFITRAKYTEENITQLIDVMKIINPNIERPIFLKPINDTKLFIDYKPIKTHSSYTPQWMSDANFYKIGIYRKFGDRIYEIYDICTIPADIESSGDFATESTDLTSNVMLFRIFKLFNDGRLLHNYVPPYYIIDGEYIKYINLMIHFNRYKSFNNWLYDMETGIKRNKKEFIDMFKSYAGEINNFIN